MKNNYVLDRGQKDQGKEQKQMREGFMVGMKKTVRSVKEFFTFIKEDAKKLPIAFVIIILDSISNILTPYLIARAVDLYIVTGDVGGLTGIIIILVVIYIVTIFTGYSQGILMGLVSQRTLYRLREALFAKLQELPIAFFNQNKAGDLMSRVNNDADKINQFLGEGIARLVGVASTVFGIAIFVFFINIKMAIAMMLMVLFLVIITRLLSGWVTKTSRKSLNVLGNFNAALQENLTNFRVVVAYDKRQYFKNYLNKINAENREATKRGDIAVRVFEPIYDFAGAFALIIVVSFGIYMISVGEITTGILIAFIAYTLQFYDPLKTLASIFGSIQSSIAAWTRITDIFNMKDNLIVTSVDNHVVSELWGGTQSARPERAKASEAGSQAEPAGEDLRGGNFVDGSEAKNLRMELRDVTFSYEDGANVLENVSLQFEAGKTYALVGPTGGGKSTLASLMSRLYDPDTGTVFLNGRDIRSYEKGERAGKISVILQEPILFSGTVGDNIRYGNLDIAEKADEELEKMLLVQGFVEVMKRFDNGLATKIEQSAGGGLSLGQKQLISFMRAILRQPELLILDEATANIDTVTEAILEKALTTLPKETTKIIIAHRLNTIREADQIMFVNGHHVTLAGSLEEAIHLIENAKRTS